MWLGDSPRGHVMGSLWGHMTHRLLPTGCVEVVPLIQQMASVLFLECRCQPHGSWGALRRPGPQDSGRVHPERAVLGLGLWEQWAVGGSGPIRGQPPSLAFSLGFQHAITANTLPQMNFSEPSLWEGDPAHNSLGVCPGCGHKQPGAAPQGSIYCPKPEVSNLNRAQEPGRLCPSVKLTQCKMRKKQGLTRPGHHAPTEAITVLFLQNRWFQRKYLQD